MPRSRVDHGRRLGPEHDGHHDAAKDHEVVHPDEEGGALDRVHLRLRRPGRADRTPQLSEFQSLKRCHLFSLVATASEVKTRMRSARVGRTHDIGGELEIGVEVGIGVGIGGVRGIEGGYGGTVRSSISMPALAAACLMTACIFCDRGIGAEW